MEDGKTQANQGGMEGRVLLSEGSMWLGSLFGVRLWLWSFIC